MPGLVYPSSVVFIAASYRSLGLECGAGLAQLGADRGREQGGVRADAHEGPALLEPPAGGEDLVGGLDERRGGEVAGDAEVVAEVARADEQHVHPVQGGYLVGDT